jgi:dephospho-CoA kinase
MNIIAFTGPIGSGKTIAGEILQRRGFKSFSLTDGILAELEKTRPGEPVTRTVKQDMGDKGRLEHGNDYWAKLAADRAATAISEGTSDILIDSIYNPAEIDYLRERFPGIVVIGFNATLTLREQRINVRRKDGDPVGDEDELAAVLTRDLGYGQPDNGQQVRRCLKRAGIIINNNIDDPRELERFLDEALAMSGLEGARDPRERR